MSRVDFLKDVITTDNPTYDLTHYFNEINVLYGILGGRSDIDILISNNRGRPGFSILLEEEESAEDLRDRCNGCKFSTCKGTYKLKANRQSNTVIVSMTKLKEA